LTFAFILVIKHYNADEFYFFFSSRRRHTRFSRDWSSDVCSSDLTKMILKKYWNFLSMSWLNVFIISALISHSVLKPKLSWQKRRSEERRVGKECRSRW